LLEPLAADEEVLLRQQFERRRWDPVTREETVLGEEG
jgi:hypothetical protein